VSILSEEIIDIQQYIYRARERDSVMRFNWRSIRLYCCWDLCEIWLSSVYRKYLFIS